MTSTRYFVATDHGVIQQLPVRYLPPETLVGNMLEHKGLVYYVGCVVYSLLLYGTPPFFEQAHKHKLQLIELVSGANSLQISET